MSFKGKINVYVCRTCGCELVTRDKDDGTTPFLTGCVASGCNGISESRCYQVDQSLVPTHEWYRCLGHEKLFAHPASVHHHNHGGLFLRRITN